VPNLTENKSDSTSPGTSNESAGLGTAAPA
jgi:hypothetical protein